VGPPHIKETGSVYYPDNAYDRRNSSSYIGIFFLNYDHDAMILEFIRAEAGVDEKS